MICLGCLPCPPLPPPPVARPPRLCAARLRRDRHPGRPHPPQRRADVRREAAQRAEVSCWRRCEQGVEASTAHRTASPGKRLCNTGCLDSRLLRLPSRILQNMKHVRRKVCKRACAFDQPRMRGSQGRSQELPAARRLPVALCLTVVEKCCYGTARKSVRRSPFTSLLPSLNSLSVRHCDKSPVL